MSVKYHNGWDVDPLRFQVNSATGKPFDTIQDPEKMPKIAAALAVPSKLTNGGGLTPEDFLALVQPELSKINGTIALPDEVVFGKIDLKHEIARAMNFKDKTLKRARTLHRQPIIKNAIAGYIDGQPVALRANIEAACRQYREATSPRARALKGGGRPPNNRTLAKSKTRAIKSSK